MPRTTLTPEAARAILRQATDEVFLAFLTIYGAGLETIYIVNNTEPVVRGVTLFNPYPFEPILPEDSDSASPQVTLRIDNVDRRVTEAIKEYPGTPYCRMEISLASNPTHVEVGPLDFAITLIEFDAIAITATLGYEEDFLNQAAPAQCYLPSNSAGLFV